MTVLPLHVDSTMMSCFRSCPQKHFREFIQGFRPPGLSIDLHAGACFASALELTYKRVHIQGETLAQALELAHGAFMLQWGDFEIPEYKRTAKTKDRVWEAVEDYFMVYPPLTDHVQPYIRPDGSPTFEYTFAIPLEPAVDPSELMGIKSYDPNNLIRPPEFPLHPSGEPFVYCGRFDMLGAYMGRPCIRDEKTSGKSPGANWAEQWDLRSQFIGYVWACQQLGYDLDTVIVRGIAILETAINHAEAIKTYSDHIIAKWYEQLRRDMWRLRRAWDEQYFDYNLGDACTQYGCCVFLPVCQSPTPESWLSNFEVRHWSPLRSNPIEPTT